MEFLKDRLQLFEDIDLHTRQRMYRYNWKEWHLIMQQ